MYNNSVYIKPRYYVDITINRFGKAYVDEQLITGGFEDEEDDWDDNNNPAGNNGIHAMNAVSFDQFKQSLKRESFDDTRQNLAKQGIAVNYFTVAQVRELVNLFTFESNKLEIAKYAYTYTVDKGNYFMVSDSFTFSSSKDELAKYIQKFK